MAAVTAPGSGVDALLRIMEQESMLKGNLLLAR
jgi:hypothetical protein